VIRTSGEKRLSDFLLWQSGHALLHFSPVLWPDFSFLDLLGALTAYQRAAAGLAAARTAAERDCRGAAVAEPRTAHGASAPPAKPATGPTAADAARATGDSVRAAASAAAPRRRLGAAADRLRAAELEWARPANPAGQLTLPGHEEDPVAGCSCCIVRQLRFHAACSDPVPGLQAMMAKKKARDAATRAVSNGSTVGQVP
jgi:hypothetical protein